jgi:hypothetical protein
MPYLPFQQFKKQIQHPLKYRLFLLSQLPMGLISGLRIRQLSQQQAAVSVKFSWVNKNPFRSIYFAVLSMAAELSTGVLAYGLLYKRTPAVSMLVLRCEADFLKKATGTITFTCTDGNLIAAAIEQTLATGEGVTVRCTATGVNQQGEKVARFVFVWTFKAKNPTPGV